MVIATPSGPSAPAVPAAGATSGLFVRGGLAVRLREVDVEGAGVLGDEYACIAAEDREGRTVGRAVYRRVYGPRAELTLEIDDALWHSGLPALLVASLCQHAARVGITKLLARVPARDIVLLALLREDFAGHETRDGTHVDVELSTAVALPSGWTTEPDERSSPDGTRRPDT